MHGVVPTADALRMAREAGLDLVEMSPTERPPVCKIMDYGKYKYDLSKKQKQKHHEQKIKEIRVRPKTDDHDLEIKLQHARKFLEHGDRVQVTMLFRGRERFRQDLARDQFNEIVTMLADVAKVERPPRSMGRRMTCLFVPLKAAAVKKPQQKKPKKKPEDAGARTGEQAKAEQGAAPAAGPAASTTDASATASVPTPVPQQKDAAASPDTPAEANR
jgi:translation initiation factor IF-3